MTSKIESAVETPDGTRSVFNTTTPYVAGSVIVFVNGLGSVATADNGWIELSGTQVQLKITPKAIDTVSFYYMIP
jgi:hypothetical protein